MRIAKMLLGGVLVAIGLVALVTPLTPGAWLIFVGLELLGIRLIVWDKNGRVGRWLMAHGFPEKYFKKTNNHNGH
jgi:uncharacterized protein YqgC (DUF456 family)